MDKQLDRNVSTCIAEMFISRKPVLASILQHRTTKQQEDILSQPHHLLFEKTTGSSPVVSRNWSLQSSSHVLAYPSSNRTSRSRRMLTVAMRSSVIRFTQCESSVRWEDRLPRTANGFPTQLAGPARNRHASATSPPILKQGVSP